jgi:hypothetical protein
MADRVTSMQAQRQPRGQHRAARVAPAAVAPALAPGPAVERSPKASIEAISIGEPTEIDSLATLLLANYAPKPRPLLKVVSDENARHPVPAEQ